MALSVCVCVCVCACVWPRLRGAGDVKAPYSVSTSRRLHAYASDRIARRRLTYCAQNYRTDICCRRPPTVDYPQLALNRSAAGKRLKTVADRSTSGNRRLIANNTTATFTG